MTTLQNFDRYAQGDRHVNVGVKNEAGHTRYFDETQLEPAE